MKLILTIINLIFCFLGLVSSILPETDKHYETLLKWLDDIAAGVSSWLPCYSVTNDNWNVAHFHTKCDYKSATVTLVKVGDYIFGGFSDENWGGIICLFSCVFMKNYFEQPGRIKPFHKMGKKIGSV